MNPIRVYDKYLDLQGESDTYQSLQYKRSYHSVGDFELHINRYMHHADRFQKGCIIALNKQANKAGLITNREIELDESGKESENFKLTGTTLDGIMNRRSTVPPEGKSHDRITDDAETVMKHYVDRHFVNPDDPKRKIKILEIADNQHRGQKVEWESRYKNVADELEEISKESGLGWGIFVDFKNKKLIFDVIEAKDLTQTNEDGNNPVFFSPEFETIKNQSFVESDDDYKNVGYVGGQGEGEERRIVEIGDATGWDRIETFVDARDVSDKDEDDNELPEEEIIENLTKRGKKKLKEHERVFSLEAEILTPITRKEYEYTHEGYLHPAQVTGRYRQKEKRITPFQYEQDFDLGDKVDIVNKSWGLKMAAPITEFMEVHEKSGFRLEATFGRDRPTLLTKLEKRFKELEGIEKQEYPSGVAVEKMNEAKQFTAGYTWDKDSIDGGDKKNAMAIMELASKMFEGGDE